MGGGRTGPASAERKFFNNRLQHPVARPDGCSDERADADVNHRVLRREALDQPPTSKTRRFRTHHAGVQTTEDDAERDDGQEEVHSRVDPGMLEAPPPEEFAKVQRHRHGRAVLSRQRLCLCREGDPQAHLECVEGKPYSSA
jgi:hypothetical protein